MDGIVGGIGGKQLFRVPVLEHFWLGRARPDNETEDVDNGKGPHPKVPDFCRR